MGPSRLVLLRFHRAPDVCRSRLELLRALNPGVPIHGLFGGPAADPERTCEALEGRLDGVFRPPGRAGAWMWLHGDLCMRAWFQQVGFRLRFDVVHLVEWDLLLLSPLEALYGHVPQGAVALTGLEPVESVRPFWMFLAPPRDRNYLSFAGLMQAELGWEGPPLACQGPGPAFPRRFLEAYANLEPSELVHEELRLPAMAQALGFPLVDSGLSPGWATGVPSPEFNCNKVEVEPERIRAALADPRGRRAFHPFSSPWPLP